MDTVLTLNTHIGTHIDAPRHFLADGGPVDELPLDGLVMRDAVVLDVSGKPAGAGVSGDDLERTGVVPSPGQIAVIKTLWTDRAWGQPEFWNDTIHLEPSVSEWTAARGVAAVAMDCFPEKPFWRMVLLNTYSGVRSVDPVQLQTARTFGVSGWKLLWQIVLPASSPYIFTGMRVSLAVALIVMVISEMVAASSGIGYFILSAQRGFKIREMFAGVLTLAALGYILNRLFLMIENRVLAWHYGYTQQQRN